MSDRLYKAAKSKMLNNKQILYVSIDVTNEWDFYLFLILFGVEVRLKLAIKNPTCSEYACYWWLVHIYYTPNYQIIEWVLDAYGFELAIDNRLQKRIRRKND